MAKQPPSDPAKKNVARRDDGPTHEMSTHPEFGDDSVEDSTEQAVVPAELLKKPFGDTRIEPHPPARPEPKPASGDRTAPETKLPGSRPEPRPPSGDRTAPETKLPASRPDPKPAAGDRPAPETKVPASRPDPKPAAGDRTAPETKLSSLYDAKPGFSSDTHVEPAPTSRESGGHKAASREPKEAKEPREPKEPKEKPGFSSDTRVEPAPPARESKESKAAAREPKEAKEQKAPKGFFERTDPNAAPQAPSTPAEPSAENALPWESGESPFGATTPLPDLRDQLPPEAPPAPSEPWPDEPVLQEPPKRTGPRDGLRRVSSPSVPVAEPPKKAAKPTRDAVPISVASQETNVRAAPTSRDVAGQETRIKAAPTADERSSRSVASQDTSIKPAPEEPVRRKTGAHPAVRGDFPEADPPRRGGNVANSSTLLKPIPEDVQRELGVEKPARRSGSRDAARKPAPIERPDPTFAHGVEPAPEPEEEQAPVCKPKPLPFVDKRPRLASSADLFEATVQDPEKQGGRPRGAKRVDQRVSKVFQTLSHLKTMSEGNQKGLAIVAGVFALIVIAVIAVGMARGGDKPREDELRRAYPFGYSGARGPRGEQAPGAAELKFTFKMVAPCPQTAEPECLLYEYSKGNFAGRMLLRKTSDGWVRASDEGAPFLMMK